VLRTGLAELSTQSNLLVSEGQGEASNHSNWECFLNNLRVLHTAHTRFLSVCLDTTSHAHPLWIQAVTQRGSSAVDASCHSRAQQEEEKNMAGDVRLGCLASPSFGALAMGHSRAHFSARACALFHMQVVLNH